MSRCSTAVLAEHAAVHDDGRVDIIGGHLRELTVEEFPERVRAWLVLIVEFDWTETTREHRLAVDVVDRHGVPRGYRMSRPVQVAPRSSGQPATTQSVAVPISVVARHADDLVVRARLDDDVIAELPVRVGQITRRGR